MSQVKNRRRRTTLIGRFILLLNLLAVGGLICAYLATKIPPDENKWLPFFGLSYPVWIGANLFFVLLWMLRERIYFLLSLLTIVFGWGYLSDFLQISFSSKAASESSTLKVLSYNVKLFGFYSWSNNEEIRNNIFDFLRKENADILCFQEFYHTDKKTGFVTKDSLMKVINNPYLHERYTHEFIHKQYFGVVTISRYPIINKGEVPFNNDINNFCIYSDIKINDDTIRVFNAHLASIRFQPEDYEFIDEVKSDAANSNLNQSREIAKRLQLAFIKRAQQIREVVAEIKRSPYPVIFAGDFNDTPISYAYELVANELIDSFVESGNGIGNTYIGNFPSFRIDYIFHSQQLRAHKFKTYSQKFSDHHPVSCLIEIP